MNCTAPRIQGTQTNDTHWLYTCACVCACVCTNREDSSQIGKWRKSQLVNSTFHQTSKTDLALKQDPGTNRNTNRDLNTNEHNSPRSTIGPFLLRCDLQSLLDPPGRAGWWGLPEAPARLLARLWRSPSGTCPQRRDGILVAVAWAVCEVSTRVHCRSPALA